MQEIEGIGDRRLMENVEREKSEMKKTDSETEIMTNSPLTTEMSRKQH